MRAAALLLAVAAAAAAQSEPALRREGSVWTGALHGVVPAANRLKIVARGAVVVRGEGREGVISYALQARIRAQNAEAARKLFQSLEVRARTQGEWTALTVVAAEGSAVSTQFLLSAPRRAARVLIETLGGSAEAYDLDGFVEARSGGGNLRMDRIGAGIVAKTGGGEIQIGTVGGPVRALSGGGSIQIASAGGESWAETAGGEIHVTEAKAPLHLSTAGGNLRVDRASSSVLAHTEGGRIDIGQAGGPVVAENAGGIIQIGAARGVRCESAAGTIRLRGVSGALRASTAVGTILAELPNGAPLEDSFLATGSGDITVWIPPGVPLTIQAFNRAAGIRNIISEFPEIRVLLPGTGTRDFARAEGTLNGGGPLLRVDAAGGTIYLRRQP
jgi:hypothetical protein